jgi:transposase
LKRRRERLARALEEMTQRGLDKAEDKLTVTEPEAGIKRQKNGSFAPGYNPQVVSDLDSGVIVNAEIVDAGNDCGQLKPQLDKARAVLEAIQGGPSADGPPSATADGAYHDTRQLDELERGGTECYVPEARNTHRKAPGVTDAYQADAFIYEAATDTMRCPEGQSLLRRKTNRLNTADVYKASAKTCAACPAKGQCCPKTKSGRSVNRTMEPYQAILDRVAARLETGQGRRRLKQRWITCEGVFARLVGLLHWRRNRMWGLQGARAELAWRVLTHNLLILLGIWKPMTLGGAESQA